MRIIENINVVPINNIEVNLGKFHTHHSNIAKFRFNNKFRKIIEVSIACDFKQAETNETIKENNRCGFIFVPSSYVLGLGIEYPHLIKKYGCISSIDDNNLLPNKNGGGYLSLRHAYGKNELYLIDRCGTWGVCWNFLVVPIGTILF